MKLKELLPVLPISFLVYDNTHDTIFNVEFFRMLYTPKYAHYLDYQVMLLESSDHHVVVNIQEVGYAG